MLSDLAFDLEWSNGRITAVGIAYNEKEAYSTYDNAESEWLKVQLVSGQRICAGHNICTADLVVLGFTPKQIRDFTAIFDTMLAAHLIHPHWAGAGSEDYAGEGHLGLYDLGSLVRFYNPTSNWKPYKEDLLEYNGRDCAYTYRLYQNLKRDLLITGQQHLLTKAHKLAAMTVGMHERGVKLDVPALETYARELKKRREELAASFSFNPRSPKQIKAWAKERGIKLKDTEFETLQKHEGKDEEFDKLIKYKEDSKSLTTWFPIEEDEQGELHVTSEYIHPTYHVTGTSVGRPSCTGPNDLNVPEGGRRELSGGRVKEMPNLRRFHIARQPDLRIVSFDFSQIENRMLAYLSGDKFSMEIFNSGKKPHRIMAAEIFKKRYEEVTESEYLRGKKTVHGTGYGETPEHLAVEIFGRRDARSVAEAKWLQAAYFRLCPGIKAFQQRISQQLDRGNLTLRNPFGRTRKVYAPNSHERLKRGVHFMGSSTATDLVNERAIGIWEEFDLLPLKWVYDELAFEFPYGEKADKQIKEVKEYLEQPCAVLGNMVVPVKAKEGYQYSPMKELVL